MYNFFRKIKTSVIKNWRDRYFDIIIFHDFIPLQIYYIYVYTEYEKMLTSPIQYYNIDITIFCSPLPPMKTTRFSYNSHAGAGDKVIKL